MNTRILFIILFTLSFCCAYSQEQAPAIEWIEPYSGGTRGGSITAFQGPNALFALTKEQNSISGSASISKFYADGLVKTQYLITEGGSSNAPIISQYASQDGGVLVYLFFSKVLRKYDATLNLSWEKTIDFKIENASATLADGFYVLSNNDKFIPELKRMKSDGTIEWSIDITGFANKLIDIKTTSDDGVILAGLNGLRKYSNTGQLVWSNTSILDASRLIVSDPSTMYIYTAGRNIIQLNTSTGNTNWTKASEGEIIFDFDRTFDNGCVLSSNIGLYKYNSTGNLQWKNTDYSSARLTTTADGKIFAIKNNTITKLTFNNEQVWAKSFNSDYYIIQDVNGASDFGLYVTAVKNGIYFNNSPDFLLFKLASPDTPCKTNFDIVGESATFCKIGSLTLSSKLSNVQMEYMSYLTNLSFQWYKNNAPIESANNYSYTATQTGNYSLILKQQGCVSSSRSLELNIINETPPALEAEKTTICIGSSVNITAKGCNGTVVWSTGARTSQIKVTPQGTTAYNAICESFFNNELCQSPSSNNITITVLSSSNLNINDIVGKREFCENGSTELKPTVSGGVLPLSYTWTKNATSIANTANFSASEEGDYILQVSDNIGCHAQSDLIPIKKIANPATPTINPPLSTVLCYKGSILLTTEAKENSYQWILDSVQLNGAVNQSYMANSSGSYKLKVTNSNGCSSISDAIVIRVSDLRLGFIEGKVEFCEGSSTELSISISGGVEPFKYEWIRYDTVLSQNNKLIVKETGSYSLTVTDNAGCIAHTLPFSAREVSNPVAPTISSPSGTEICIGGKVVLTTTSKEAHYQWYLNNKEVEEANDAFYTATLPGKYELKVVNITGCENMSEGAINVTQIIIPQPTIRQSNDSLISSASTGNKWYFNTTELPLTSQKIKFTEVGNYQVKVFEKGCESAISANFIPIILANEQEAPHIQVYPNPSSDKVFIKSSKAFAYQLIDITGRLLNQSTSKNFSHTIDLNRFPSGNYLIILQEENGNNFVKKLSVNR